MTTYFLLKRKNDKTIVRKIKPPCVRAPPPAWHGGFALAVLARRRTPRWVRPYKYRGARAAAPVVRGPLVHTTRPATNRTLGSRDSSSRSHARRRVRRVPTAERPRTWRGRALGGTVRSGRAGFRGQEHGTGRDGAAAAGLPCDPVQRVSSVVGLFTVPLTTHSVRP